MEACFCHRIKLLCLFISQFSLFTVINRNLFSDKMLIYQHIDVLISVLDHCNILTTINHHSSDESYMSNHSSSQVNE